MCGVDVDGLLDDEDADEPLTDDPEKFPGEEHEKPRMMTTRCTARKRT
jgi:hypothetical protein